MRRWYYTSGMRTDECYIWIGYHSCKGGPRFIPHTGKIPDPHLSDCALPGCESY